MNEIKQDNKNLSEKNEELKKTLVKIENNKNNELFEKIEILVKEKQILKETLLDIRHNKKVINSQNDELVE